MLHVLHRDLLRRQENALDLEPYGAIVHERFAQGARAAEKVLAALPVADIGVKIRPAAALGICLHDAVEQWLYGAPNSRTPRAAVAFARANVLLDTILDEECHLVEFNRDDLVSVLRGEVEPNSWQDSPSGEVLRTLASWRDEIKRGRGWRENASLQEKWICAAEAALDAEFDSVRDQQIGRQVVVERALATMRAKSQASMQLQGISVLCLNEPLPSSEAVLFDAAMASLGTFGGWLDDLLDLMIDLDSECWNVASLRLYDALGRPEWDAPSEIIDVLKRRLAYERSIRHLISHGRNLYDDLEGSVQRLRSAGATGFMAFIRDAASLLLCSSP